MSLVYHIVKIVDHTGSTDVALEALVDVHPDPSAVGALWVYGPEIAQGIHMPVLEEHLQVLYSSVEM
jgi:hypothetical protein